MVCSNDTSIRLSKYFLTKGSNIKYNQYDNDKRRNEDSSSTRPSITTLLNETDST